MPTPDQIIFTNSATSSNPLSMDQVRGLFGDVTREQSAAGLVDYADVFIRNLSTPDDPLENATVDITRPTPSPDTSIKLAVTIPTANRPAAANFIGAGPGGPPTGVTIGTSTTVFTDTITSGGITADANNFYILSANTLRPFSRTSPFTAGTPIDLPSTHTYVGIARDDSYFWVWDEASNDVYRIDHDGGNPVQYSINTPASLRHVGMARVGNQLYISDGDTSRVHVYDIPATGTTLTRTRQITAPIQSYGFWADANFLYYMNYGGAIRIHRNSDNVEVARGTGLGSSRVGLTFIDGALYSSGEGGSGRQVRRTPLTFTGSVGLPIRLGNFTGTRRLWIERTVTAGATAFANDMPRITVRETSGE